MSLLSSVGRAPDVSNPSGHVPKAKPTPPLVLAICGVVWVMASLISLSSGDQLRYPDEKDYHNLALNLVHAHGFVDERRQPSAARPPGYPLVLSAVYAVWERPLAAKLLNSFACGLTALVLSLIASSIGSRIAGIVAPLLVLCFPLFSYTASTLYPQTVGTLLFVSAIFFLVRFPSSSKGTIIAGGLFGFLVLMIPAFLLLLPLFPAYLMIVDRLNADPMFRRALLFLGCAALVVAPWTLRNFLQFKSFIPVSTNTGINLLLGNSPNTKADSGVNVDISNYVEAAEGMDEVQKDNFFKHAAISFVKRDPVAALLLYCRKVVNYFNFRNQLYISSERSSLRDTVMLLTYYPLLLLAVLRLLLYRRFKINPTEAFLFLLYFGNAFLSAIFFTRIRFRIPFDALLIILVALFVGLIHSRRESLLAEMRQVRLPSGQEK